MPIIYCKASKRAEIERLIRLLPAILAGRVPDRDGVAHGFRMRMAWMFFSLVKEAFIVKSRGGVDECGIRWPKLSAKYLAYQRPMGRGGRGSRNPPRAGGLAPGGNDGFMSKADLARWRKTYATALGRLMLAGVADAKSRAAAIAWAQAKRNGVKTKLGVFGDREVEILRDRGLLFNSLSPGVVTDSGADAGYVPAVDQVADADASSLTVGTAVSYARWHHYGKRPFWPRDGRLPDSWWEDILEVAWSGIVELLKERGRA